MPVRSTARDAACFGLAWVVVVIAALPAPCLAQTLPFEVLGLNEGLPQSQVNTVAQDALGYIWVGTWGGLARYDGNHFTSFDMDSGLPSSRIQELLAARSGDLWVATVNGLARFSGRSLHVEGDPPVSGVRCRCVAEDAGGTIWVGTDQGLAVRTGGTFRSLDLPGLADVPRVYDLSPQGAGVVAATTAGLFYCESPARAVPIPGPSAPAWSFRAVVEDEGTLWLGTEGHGLWASERGAWALVPLGGSVAPFIYSLSRNRAGTLYVCTQEEGLYLRDPRGNTFQRWGVENGLPSSVVNCAFEDREGSVWIGTDIGGLARVGSLAVTSFGRTQGLPDSCVFGITASQSTGRLWVSTLHGAALLEADPTPRVVETLALGQGLENEWVWKTIETTSGALFILTDQSLQVRPPGSRRVASTPPEATFVKGLTIDMTMDAAGRIWVCGEDPVRQGETVRGGLRMTDGRGAWKSWKASDQGHSLLLCRRVAPRRAGGVWVGTTDQVIAWCDGAGAHELPGMPPLPSKANLSALFEDSAGRLWVSNESGLAVRDTDGQWRLMNDAPGFTSRHVYSIGEDRGGVIWVGTSRGVFRFLPDGTVRALTPEDGLASYEANQGGFLCDSRGDVWIGTVAGLSRYRAELQMANSTPPSLVVEAAELPDRLLERPTGLSLAWSERSVTFRVAVLSFRDHGRCGYRARMGGLEDTWLPVRSSGELRYTNLPPGSHQLLLQAVNESGVWGRTVALPIRVRPPFWMTLWFRVCAVLVVALLAVGAHRWRTLILRRRNEELTSLVDARTHELLVANGQLDFMANHDALTGLLNRRAVIARFEEALASGTGRRKVGCLLVDLDGFKQVNDLLGHAAGDEVLQEVARFLRASLRDGDWLGRLGGDEFLAVLPGADRTALESAAARVSQLEIRPGKAGSELVVTASCGGVVGTGQTGGGAAAVLAAADQLMYEVKKSGKNGFRTAVLGETD